MKKQTRNKEQYELYVKLTVDSMVLETDFPVIGKVLAEAGIADRQQVRKLIKDGVLSSMYVSVGTGHITAYYTEDVLPKFERERRAIADGTNIQHEQLDAGEELVEVGEETGRDAEHIQEVGYEAGEEGATSYHGEREQRRQDQQEINDSIEVIYEDDSGVVSSEGIESDT